MSRGDSESRNAWFCT